MNDLPLYDKRAIAEELLGQGGLSWDERGRALCECPGKAFHSGKQGRRDCRVTIDERAPTIYCVHSSCQAEVAEANRQLRSAIGRAKAEASRAAAVDTGPWVKKPRKAAPAFAPRTPATKEPEASERSDPTLRTGCESPAEGGAAVVVDVGAFAAWQAQQAVPRSSSSPTARTVKEGLNSGPAAPPGKKKSPGDFAGGMPNHSSKESVVRSQNKTSKAALVDTTPFTWVVKDPAGGPDTIHRCRRREDGSTEILFTFDNGRRKPAATPNDTEDDDQPD